MRQLPQRRKLLGAVLHPARRHVGLEVPLQHRSGAVQVVGFAQGGTEPLKRRGHAGTLTRRRRAGSRGRGGHKRSARSSTGRR